MTIIFTKYQIAIETKKSDKVNFLILSLHLIRSFTFFGVPKGPGISNQVLRRSLISSITFNRRHYPYQWIRAHQRIAFGF